MGDAAAKRHAHGLDLGVLAHGLGEAVNPVGVERDGDLGVALDAAHAGEDLGDVDLPPGGNVFATLGVVEKVGEVVAIDRPGAQPGGAGERGRGGSGAGRRGVSHGVGRRSP